MASIFLSYARDDRTRAERIARAMEDAGHSVWWDLQVHAGSRFSAEIDKALKAADRIVVLWSTASVESAWVHDEAAAGRDTGRLLPILIDPVEPPLGFRQFQAIDLSRWSGRGTPRALGQLLQSLGTRAAEPARVPSGARATRRAALLGALVAVMLIGAAFLWFRSAADRSSTLAIAASETGATAASRDFAHQVALDLTRFQPASLNSITILDEASPQTGAAYRAQIGLSGDRTAPGADISLLVKGRPGVAWVANIEGHPDHPADLRQQAASALSNTLSCAITADASKAKLGDSDFRLFLDACAKLGRDFLSFSSGDLVPAFKKLTASAPDFAPAHALLALAQYNSVFSVADHEQPATMKSAREALDRAKRLDPESEDVIAADSLLHTFDPHQWRHAFSVLDRGLKLHPNSAILLGLRADRLMMVGRTREAVENARQALSYDPLSAQVRVNFINALTSANRFPEARQELTRAEAIWPNTAVLSDARFRMDLRYGNPQAALYQLQTTGSGDLKRVPFDESWPNFLRARIDPSPSNVEAALQSFRARYRRNPADIPGYIQALATFGRTDEAFRAASNRAALDSLQASTDILFRPHMRSLTNDPRFMQLASRLGLLSYWRASGVWPDFCDDPKLSYDCAGEAAKYPG